MADYLRHAQNAKRASWSVPSSASHEQVEALRSALQRTLDAYISSNYTCRIAQDDPVIVQARAALYLTMTIKEADRG